METNKKRKYFPSSFLIIIGLMLLFIISSWIGKAITDDITGVGILDVFTSIWRGFANKVEVILFILAIGGSLSVMAKIKAIDAGIGKLVEILGEKVWILIPVLMFIFGLGGTTYGMWEETIAFIPILIPVFKKANYGSFTAIMVILLGAGTGCLASTINPFSVGSAVSATKEDGESIIANLNATPGILQGTRWISFILFELVAIVIVSWMASRYRKGVLAKYDTDAQAIQESKTSNKLVQFFTRARIVDGIDNKLIEKRFKETEKIEFTVRRKVSLGLFVTTFLLMILLYLPWGDWLSLESSRADYSKSMFWFASTNESSGFATIGNWYFISVAGLFLLSAIIIFAINFRDFKSADENYEQGFINTYMSGVKDVISVCLLIAVAGGLGNILDGTGFGKLIAENAAKGLSNWMAFGIVIFFVSIILSLLVPSTSGFAGAFIPIFAAIGAKAFPGSEATAFGIAMLGFLFANGLANFVTPTSAALMGYTQYAGVPYNTWIKQTWKFTLALFILSFILIMIFSAMASNGSSLF